MNTKTTQRGRFDARTIVSPMRCGTETKNQDRARWSPAAQVAVVCDGVTSAPFAAEAAELITSASPVLFDRHPLERLRILCGLLYQRRAEAMELDLHLPENTPPAMQAMLAEVARENLKNAFQTTLAALRLQAGKQVVQADMLTCGDSALFAFGPDGTLLHTSLVSGPENSDSPAVGHGSDAQAVLLEAGSQMRVRVLGDGRAHRMLMQRAGILQPESWLVCRMLGAWPRPRTVPTGPSQRTGKFRFMPDQLLLIPRHLVDALKDPDPGDCRRVQFPRSMRITRVQPPLHEAIRFDRRGSVTAVLPDHLETGECRYLQEKFPPDTQFLLATDGFYSGFENPEQIWDWLLVNARLLERPDERADLLRALHERLHAARGDDDISFVWVFPREGQSQARRVCCPAQSEDANAC